MTCTGVIRQQASDGVLQRGKGWAGEGGVDCSVVQTDLLLEPEQHNERSCQEEFGDTHGFEKVLSIDFVFGGFNFI